MVDKKKVIKLRVGEIPPYAQEDIGSGLVRIDSQVMQKLGIREGQAIEIGGSRKTVARAARSYPQDAGLGIIRMDGYLRKNAGTSLGEKVDVTPAEVKEAKKIVLAPAEAGIFIQISNPAMLKRALIGRAVIQGDIVVPSAKKERANSIFDDVFRNFEMNFNLGFEEIKLMVTSTTPKTMVSITEQTQIEIKPQAVERIEDSMPAVPDVTYEDIGGLENEIQKVREMIELPLKRPEVFKRLGIKPPSGVLLYGPPGTGKTLLAKAVANEADAFFTSINGPEIMSKYYGESEKKLREIFKESQENSPAIIFIDEIDSIAPKRAETRGEVERRVVAQLLSLMDGLNARQNVVVIAATNRKDDIDEALRRPGRFDREIEIGVPNKNGRKEILQIHTRNMPLAKDVDLDEIASKTHGYVGADLGALCKEAAMTTLRRVLPEINTEKEDVSPEILEKLIVNMADMKHGMRLVEPSAMREVLVQIPNTKWTQVGGLENVKAKLKEMIEWPLTHPDSFKKLGIAAPKGILLYGMPGTGKTLLAKAVATESEANFITIKGPSVFSKWVGESEKAIRKIFSKARQVAPCILFIDEIDSVAPRRGSSSDSGVGNRVVNQLLAEMDGIESLEGVTIIAATNRPDVMDPALLRPGRIDNLVYVPVPDKKARLEIFKVHTKNMPLDKDVNLDDLAEKTEKYVGADIESICREAAMIALRKNINSKKVGKKEFAAALKTINPSAENEAIKQFEQMTNRMKIPDKPKIDYYA